VKPFGKRPFGGLKRRWVDNMKMNLREVGCEDGGGWKWLRIT
jgi:hypothetical protein